MCSRGKRLHTENWEACRILETLERINKHFKFSAMGVLTVFENSGSEQEILPQEAKGQENKATSDAGGNFDVAASFVEQLGFHIEPAPKDGNCQFHVLSQCAQAQGWDLGTAEEARKVACYYLKQNAEKFQHFVAGDFADYVRGMRKSGTYGDHLTLQAFAEQTGFWIHIYQLEGPKAPFHLRKTTLRHQCEEFRAASPVNISVHFAKASKSSPHIGVHIKLDLAGAFDHLNHASVQSYLQLLPQTSTQQQPYHAFHHRSTAIQQPPDIALHAAPSTPTPRHQRSLDNTRSSLQTIPCATRITS